MKKRLLVLIEPDDDFSVEGENYYYKFHVDVEEDESNHEALIRKIKTLKFKIIHSKEKLQYFFDNVINDEIFKNKLNTERSAENGGNMAINVCVILID